MMFKLILSGLLATLVLGCVSVEQLHKEHLEKYLGQSIAERIVAYGPPESNIRVSDRQRAFTFVKRASGMSGGMVSATPLYGGVIVTSTPISTYSKECRLTFIVEAPRDDMAEHQMRIVDVLPLKGDCT